MTHGIRSKPQELEVFDDGSFEEADVEVLEPEELDDVRDDAPHLVFLIPGIRTNGWWAQEAIMQEVLWDGREVHFVPVRGNGGGTGRLSSLHLITRLGLIGYRKHFVSQINDIASQKDYHSINVFAHSMGSSLFADIVENWPHDLMSDQKKLGTIVFLGSVCHRRHCSKLYKISKRFVNHVGTKDFLPYIASIVRPDSYSDVGSFGFLEGYSQDQFFTNNHCSCTSFEHIKSEVLPLISSSEVRPLGSPEAVVNHFNAFVYVRQVIWVLAVILATWLLVATIF